MHISSNIVNRTKSKN